jgi:hypothetical protein
MVIGAFVRGLSMRDVESLCDKAGLGKLSKSTAQRICSELKERFEAFRRRDLYDVRLAALFLDAVFLSVRPDGPKEGVLVAWGFTEQGERVLLSVMLGMRESHEDRQALGLHFGSMPTRINVTAARWNEPNGHGENLDRQFEQGAPVRRLVDDAPPSAESPTRSTN